MSRIVYGLHPVEELIRAGGEIDLIYFIDGDRNPALRALMSEAQRRRIPVEMHPKADLDAMALGQLHQGAVAVAGDFAYVEIAEVVGAATSKLESPLILVLDSIQDPQNLGALIRSAHVLGAHGMIIPKDRAAKVTSSVVKASAGASEHMPIALCTNLSRALTELQQAGLWIVGAVADTEGGQEPWKIDFTVPTALVLGAEGAGLRPLVTKGCDLLVSIPMAGRVASLNVSAAGAILLYEAARQRRQAVVPAAAVP